MSPFPTRVIICLHITEPYVLEQWISRGKAPNTL
uniref:Uncharacterized protein n=1 Tax=Arundo donax TaxID=35708 RepID=A0A0A9BNW3_ARUDO